MSLNNETATLEVSQGGGDIHGFSGVSASDFYRNVTASATDIAAAIVARRYRLPPVRARLVYELAFGRGA